MLGPSTKLAPLTLVTLPATDGLIAQLALRYGVPLLEHDGHFEHIEGLQRIPWRDLPS